MLTTFHMGHYIPVTWMTFGLDYLVWGMNPVGYHLTNLLLHVANVVTFYFVAARLLEAARPSTASHVGQQFGAAETEPIGGAERSGSAIGRVLVLGAVFATTIHLVCLGASAQGSGLTSSPPGAAPKPPYVQRGDEVEAHYRTYRERLERFYENFGARLATGAPDLLAKLLEASAAPVPYGYGILPRLVPDPPRKTGGRVGSGSYSWRRTDGFIDRDLSRLERLETRLAQPVPPDSADSRGEWMKMVDEYRTLAAHQKTISSHIEYNRLWQAEIARNRRAYDAYTGLHDAVLERQAFLDTLEAGDRVLEPYLRARVEALSRRIDGALRTCSPPDFLRVEHPSSHRWIVRVPVYTDIEDRSFVSAVQSAVENAWHVVGAADEFSVVLEIHYVPASQLYPDGRLPAHGEHIDLARHTSRFPAGGAVLTTGSNSTYVLSGRSVVVGPQDVAPNVLAHEFGHVLGFPDRYFRGYRDRGPEGFEVLEVVIDGDDIMSAASNGRVWPRHFRQLLDADRPPRTEPAPEKNVH